MSSTHRGWHRFVHAARRRGILGLLVVALGGAAGYGYARWTPTAYASTAVLVVPSGAGSAGPGAATDAETLAATYAALIPQDQAVGAAVARATGIPPASAGDHVAVTVESGSAVLDLRFTAPSPRAALDGLRAVVDAVAGAQPLSGAVGGGSLVVVRPPEAAGLASPGTASGVALGCLVGLVLGSIGAIARERADPRIDDVEDLRAELPCPSWPDHAASATVTAVFDRRREVAPAGRRAVTLVPVGRARPAALKALAGALAGSAAPDRRGPAVWDVAGDEDPGPLAPGEPIVLAVARGAPLDALRSVVHRLADLGQAPAWAFLLGAGGRGGRRHPAPPARATGETDGPAPLPPAAPRSAAGSARAAGAYVLVSLVPISAGLRRGFPVPGVNLSQAIVGAVGGWLLLTAPRHVRLRWRLFDWVALAFCSAWLGLGLLGAQQSHATPGIATLESLLGPFQFFVLYRAVLGALSTAARRARAVALLLLSSIPVDLLACLQQARIGAVQRFLAHVTGGSAVETAAYRFFARATGPFPHWTPLAGYLTVVLVVAIACRLAGAELPVPRRVLDGVVLLGSLALVLTAELSAIGAVVAASLLLGIRAGRLAEVVRALAVVSLLVGAVAGSYLQRRIGIQYGASAGSGRPWFLPQTLAFRWQVWTAQYLPAISQRLFTGWGPVLPRWVSWPFPESQYVADLMAGGIPLLALFAGELAALFGLGRDCAHRRPAERGLATALGEAAAALALVIVPMAAVYPYLTSGGMPAPLFALAGVAAAMIPAGAAPARAAPAGRPSPRWA